VSGFLIPPGNAEALAEKIELGLQDPERRMTMARNAHRIFGETYAPESNLKHLLRAYEKTVSRQKAPARLARAQST